MSSPEMTKPVTQAFWDTEDSRTADERTIVMFGVNRGGTTSVAGVCQQLGLFIGDKMDGNLEDRDLIPNRGAENLSAAITERNSRFPVWGWKFPHLTERLPDLLPQLRNPRFIIVTRDVTANLIGMTTRNDRDAIKALGVVMRRTRKNVEFARRHKRPTLFVSYEKVLLSTEASVQEIADFVGLTPTAAQFEAACDFVKPGAYQAERERLANGQ